MSTKHKSLPSQERLQELFEYRDGFLYWRRGTVGHRAGVSLGSPNNAGYWCGQVDGRIFLVHRLIWAWHYGDPGEHKIDHIDRDKSNNRIENLRMATVAQNTFNAGVSRPNPFGVPGVRHDKRGFYFRRKNGSRIYFNTWFEVIHARYDYEIEEWGDPRKETVQALLHL